MTMKMIMLTYNEAIDLEVMETLEDCGLKNYTKLLGAHGKGTTSGTHLGTDIWPGRNNVLYVAAPEANAAQMMKCVRKLRERYGKEGIKAFILPVEEMT